jgi:Sulfate permease family
VVGVLKLGFVTELLSLPIRYGYINGIILTIVVGQMHKLLGFEAHGDSFLQQMRELASGIGAGKINTLAAAIGVFRGGGKRISRVACRRMARLGGQRVAGRFRQRCLFFMQVRNLP